MAINWGLGQGGPNAGDMFMRGLEQGQAARKERQVGNALAMLARDPNSTEGANALLQADPRAGYGVMQDQRAAQAQQAKQQAIGGALRGEPGAMDALAGIDQNMWMKLDDRTKQRVKQATEFMSNAGYAISRLPPEQRPAAWAGYVRQAEASGLDIPTQYETYSDQSLASAMAEAGQTAAWLKSMEPDYKPVGEGGLAGFQYGVPIQQGSAVRNFAPAQGGPVAQNPAPNGQAGLTPDQAAPIIQGAQQSGTISRSDAMRIQQSLGPQGAAKFQQWMQKHNVRVADQGGGDLEAQAQEAIRQGADPQAVNARLQQMKGGQ